MRYLPIVLSLLVLLLNGCISADDQLANLVSSGEFWTDGDKGRVKLPEALSQKLRKFLILEEFDTSIPVGADGGVPIVVYLDGEAQAELFVSGGYWTSDQDSRMWQTDCDLPTDVYAELLDFSASLASPENMLPCIKGP